MSLRVYVASKFEARADVREVRDMLKVRGMTPVCSWVDAGDSGSDWFETLPPEQISGIVDRNDGELLSAHVVLMIAHESGGRESYATCGRALGAEIPVVWLGPTRCLTAYRKGVMRVADVHDAVSRLESLHQRVGRPWPVTDDCAREAAWRLATSGSEVAA